MAVWLPVFWAAPGLQTTSISQRPVDIEDIKAIIARHPDINVKQVLSTVREFAGLLEMPEVYRKIELLLK